MKAVDPEPNPEEPLPKFRLNSQVFQIVGLLAVALALPITILILGVLGIQKERRDARQTLEPTPVAELPGLRQSLEAIADATLSVAPVDSPVRTFWLQAQSNEIVQKKRAELLDCFTRTPAGVVETGEMTNPHWIVSLPTGEVRAFESELQKLGFVSNEGLGISGTSSAGESETVLYNIRMELPK
jgi:hypothetical protein